MNPVLETILPFFIGALGVPLITALKNQFALEGKAAVWLAGVVAVLLALASMALAGELNGEAFLIDHLPRTFGVVFAASQLAYKLLSK